MNPKVIRLPDVRALRAESQAENALNLRVRVARLAVLHGEAPPACLGAVGLPAGRPAIAAAIRDVARSAIAAFLELLELERQGQLEALQFQ